MLRAVQILVAVVRLVFHTVRFFSVAYFIKWFGTQEQKDLSNARMRCMADVCREKIRKIER